MYALAISSFSDFGQLRSFPLELSSLVGMESTAVASKSTVRSSKLKVCPECGIYAHKWLSRVNSHLVNCSKTRFCNCTTCGKQFSSRGSLKRHLSGSCVTVPAPLDFATAAPFDVYDGPTLVIDEEAECLPSPPSCQSPERFRSWSAALPCTSCL